MDLEKEDYYKILSVNPNASYKEIRRAYRRQTLRFHPDRNNGSKESNERLIKLNKAYYILSDPLKRRIYDQSRAICSVKKEKTRRLESIIIKIEVETYNSY